MNHLRRIRTFWRTPRSSIAGDLIIHVLPTNMQILKRLELNYALQDLEEWRSQEFGRPSGQFVTIDEYWLIRWMFWCCFAQHERHESEPVFFKRRLSCSTWLEPRTPQRLKEEAIIMHRPSYRDKKLWPSLRLQNHVLSNKWPMESLFEWQSFRTYWQSRKAK